MYLYQRINQEKKEREYMRQLGLGPGGFIPTPPVKDIRYISLIGSSAHTYGNALAFIQNWILDLFPKDLFRTIHVQSKIAHRQMRSVNHEFLKKNKPAIIFRPRIPNIDEERFLRGTSFIERQTDLYSTWGLTNLQPFFHDPEHEITIKYQLNRSVMYIDVLLIFETLMNQLDYYHYIVNSIRINHPFMIPTCFESYLPKETLDIISKLANVPLIDGENSTKTFLEYMNGHSMYPITYKLQGATRSREFYRYYPVNIDTIIQDVDRDEGEKTGAVMSKYQINFTVRIEFNSSGFYYIFSDRIYDISLPKVNIDDSSVIPIFTDVFLKEDLNLSQGWSLYNRASCRLDDGENTVCIDELLNNSIREAIKYHIQNALPISEFLDIKVKKQGKHLYFGVDYSIDWNTKSIHFYHTDCYHTYSIYICLNIELINELIKSVYDLK